MVDAGLTLESLRDCLAGLPSVELKGMALLKERRPSGQFFPHLAGISRDVITAAVTEIVGYSERCCRAAERLTALAPIPLTAFSILEYGL